MVCSMTAGRESTDHRTLHGKSRVGFRWGKCGGVEAEEAAKKGILFLIRESGVLFRIDQTCLPTALSDTGLLMTDLNFELSADDFLHE